MLINSTLVRTACTHTHTRLDTHSLWENCYWRGGLAIGCTGIFPSGLMNNGPMDSRLLFYFYSLINLFINFLLCLALVTMITLPPGERDMHWLGPQCSAADTATGHHWEQTKVAQRSRNSSLFRHLSGGVNSWPMSGQGNHSPSSVKDSTLICSDFTSITHGMMIFFCAFELPEIIAGSS